MANLAMVLQRYLQGTFCQVFTFYKLNTTIKSIAINLFRVIEPIFVGQSDSLCPIMQAFGLVTELTQLFICVAYLDTNQSK